MQREAPLPGSRTPGARKAQPVTSLMGRGIALMGMMR
jgi:hypothetical protein